MESDRKAHRVRFEHKHAISIMSIDGRGDVDGSDIGVQFVTDKA